VAPECDGSDVGVHVPSLSISPSASWPPPLDWYELTATHNPIALHDTAPCGS
jgi:hypothetical protein